MTTGLLIKTARKKANMTQAQLASKMGITNHCISCWEKGKRNPKYETLSRIADALGIDVNCLILGNDVVAVVRCKDCKHGGLFSAKRRLVDCPYYDDQMVDFDHFCSYGERRGEDGT